MLLIVKCGSGSSVYFQMLFFLFRCKRTRRISCLYCDRHVESVWSVRQGNFPPTNTKPLGEAVLERSLVWGVSRFIFIGKIICQSSETQSVAIHCTDKYCLIGCSGGETLQFVHNPSKRSVVHTAHCFKGWSFWSVSSGVLNFLNTFFSVYQSIISFCRDKLKKLVHFLSLILVVLFCCSAIDLSNFPSAAFVTWVVTWLYSPLLI